ncbi:hypothetical protein TSUD_391720 [Trifolium subterraneum]|uniref:SWIM-type domain-containing protein n=1 Tax=Trifolium subterraneum TaxID=3900 RepID=A0A1B5Z7A3_TRISU|nr:hypothetical protein TSUD_391720 [Trifolium subterraneum]
MAFTAVFVYKGFFVKDPELKYVGGEVRPYKADSDKWSFFEIDGIIRDFHKDAGNIRIWWKHAETPLEIGLFKIANDEDATAVSNYAVGQDAEVLIYVEYVTDATSNVAYPVCVDEVNGARTGVRTEDNGKAVVIINDEESDGSDNDDSESDGSDNDDSEDSELDVHFSDSEEERGFGVDDGFETEVVENVVEGQAEVTENVVENIVEGTSQDHEIADDEYETEELDSASDDDGEGASDKIVRYAKFKEEDMCKGFKFYVGMEFSSLDQFKKAVLKKNVLIGRQIKFAKNDANRVRAVCKSKDTCSYSVFVSRVGRTHTFRVKSLTQKHDCVRVFDNKSAKSEWIAGAIVERMKSNGDMSIKEGIADMRIRFSIAITFSRAAKARKLAKKLVDGDADRQYSLLWSYSEELRNRNPGNTCKLHFERPAPTLEPRFGRYYLCFDGAKKALKIACRPFIGVDGCHLKSKYGGQLLIAVGRDPNDQYLPVAFAVVETETKETWRWFLTLLLEDIGDSRWTFISDQQRFCLRHLYANFKKKFGGGTLMRDLMMGAAKATYAQAWEEKMNMLKEVDAKAHDWLMKVPKKSWCKHAFSFHTKCDVLMNNLSESFNATILLQRDKPIITMFEWIRTYLMGRFASLKQKCESYVGAMMPKPKKRLDWEIEKSGNWFPTWAGGLKFEVTHFHFVDKFVVDLGKRSCSCNFWELVGIPCRHAVAAITMKGEDPITYVHRYYSKMCYKDCYDQIISPINGENRWPKTDYPHILPPQFKRGPGRPKKLRRRDPDGERRGRREDGKWSRSGTTNHCTRCNEPGHNMRSCKNPAVEKCVGPSTQNVTEVTNDVQVPMPTQASQTNVVAVDNVVEVPAVAPKKRGRPRKPQTETNKPKKNKNVESANVDSDAPVIAETTLAIEAKNILKGLETLPPNELDETVKELITGLVKWQEGVGKGDVSET